VWHTVKDSGGWGESATDREIVEAIKLLARTEGIWTEPAGGTTLAVTIKLLQQGRIPKNESIVVSITGNGLKTLETVQNDLTPPPVIEAKLAEFDRLLADLEKNKAPTVARPAGAAVATSAGV
jgi:threonine synthase